MANLWDRLNTNKKNPVNQEIKQTLDQTSIEASSMDTQGEIQLEEKNLEEKQKEVNKNTSTPSNNSNQERLEELTVDSEVSVLTITDTLYLIPKNNRLKDKDFKLVKDDVQDALSKMYDADQLKNKEREPDFEDNVRGQILELVNKQNLPFTKSEKDDLTQILLDDTLGLGPIEPLLKDPTVSEIMINRRDQTYIEQSGKLKVTNIHFDDDSHMLKILNRILSPLNRTCDESTPYVDARLKDGSRVNAIIPPLAIKGPCITIRKFSKDPYTIEDLINFGTLTREVATFLKQCVQARLNIVISGGTGSGKTTLLNVLSSFIPEDERIVTVEDAAELQLRQPHVVTLESRPAGVTGKGAIHIRDLVKNTLRMRPDRIVVGECRSGEALDMLQAMNTGHDGSMTSGHANTPRDMLSRLETMVLMSGMDLPVKAIREQIASAVQLIIQQSRLQDGSRKILYLTEVNGMEGDVIVMQDIFKFNHKGFDKNGKVIGRLEATGIIPTFLPQFESKNIKVDNSLFFKGEK